MCSQYYGYNGKILTLDEIQDIFNVNGVFDGKVELITLHGSGEPLMHPNFKQVLDMIPPSVNVSFLTNGILLDVMSDIIKNYRNIVGINISMDAISDDIYRKIRGGKVYKVTQGIHTLRQALASVENNIDLTVNMTLMRINCADVKNMIDFCSDNSLKLAIWPLISDQAHSDKWIAKRDGWVFNYKESIISRDELNDIYASNISYANSKSVTLVIDDFMSHDNEEGSGVIKCDVFDYNMLYFSDGSVKHCCLQNGELFNWRNSNEAFSLNVENQKAIGLKKQGIVPDLCAGSGCPFVGKKSKSHAQVISIDESGFRGQKITFKRNKLQ
jgi:molybdenum cofactor biosynthesis enzyme MoaA